MELYSYQPLQQTSGGHTTRLLHLLPSKDGGTIEIELVEAVLSHSEADEAPEYEAISYCWGEPDNDGLKVHVRDAVTGQALGYLPVRRNIASALVHFRNRDSRRTLWIDAICIQQESNPEKSSQVRHMGEIYRLATRVVVWLGEALSHTDLAMDIIEYFESITDSNDSLLEIDLNANDRSAPFRLDDLSNHQLEALSHLIFLPWFDRLWVFQEIALARHKQRTLIQWGQRVMSFYNLCAIMRSLIPLMAYDQLENDRIKSLSNRWELFKDLELSKWHKRASIYDLSHILRSRICQDPRDRIYAVLSLCGTGAAVIPDYSPKTTARELFETICYGELQMSMRPLQDCEWPPDLEGLASWAPDLSAKARTSLGSRDPRVAGWLSNSCQLTPSWHLLCWAAYIADIVEVIPLSFGRYMPRELGRQMRTLLQKLFGERPPSNDELTLVANVLVGGMAGSARTGTDFPPLKKLVKDLRIAAYPELYSNQKRAAKATATLYLIHVVAAALIKTSKGDLGLTLSSAQVGDRVYSVPGCDTALTLRRIHGDAFRVIGQASVPGYKVGEALLGSLGSYEWLYSGNTANVVFRDTSLGLRRRIARKIQLKPRRDEELTWVDPRIQRFLGDVAIHDDLESVRKAYRQITPEILRSRGVPVQQIELV